jgi:hypothetical protein
VHVLHVGCGWDNYEAGKIINTTTQWKLLLPFQILV